MQALKPGKLAPRNEDALRELRDPARRPPVPAEPVPNEILEYRPPVAVEAPYHIFVQRFKAAPRGASSGPGLVTNEHLKIALDDEDTAELLHWAVLKLARAEVPPCIAEGFMWCSRLMALQKDNGKIQSIATASAFRRHVS